LSYDQIGDEIGKIRSQLKQRKTYFQDAKSNIKELETLISTFESNDIKYDKKQYKKAISAMESGDYLEAVELADKAKTSTEGSISEFNKVQLLKDQLSQQISEAAEFQKINFKHENLSEVDKLIAKSDFTLATTKINEIFDELNELIERKGLAIEKMDSLIAIYEESKVFVNLVDFDSSIKGIMKLIEESDFDSAILQLENLEPVLSSALLEKVSFDFVFPQGLVAKEWNKTELKITNTSRLNVKHVKIDFDGLRQRDTFSFGDINSGETGSAIGGILPEDPGSLQVKATISYETHEGEGTTTQEDWLDISRPGTPQQEIREEIKVTKAKPQTLLEHRKEVSEWRKPVGLEGDESVLLEFFEKRWDCYSRYPNNKSQLDYLHNNHEKFQIESYFEIPTDPSTVLNEWALPDNLRGNVFLDEQRNSHVRQILASPLEDNFVIIGEPGVGKTVILYEVFDSLMEKIPSGILTTSSIGDAHSGFGIRLFYDDIPENPELVNEIKNKGAKGLVVSAREADWDRLDAKFKNQFQRLTVPLFSDSDIVSLSHKILEFSSIKWDDSAIEQLKQYAQGSPIFVWSLVREMIFTGNRLLTNTYVKDNSRKGMEGYVSHILQKLLKDGSDFKTGGIHTLGCLLFLSEYMKDKKCHEFMFRSFAEIVEEDFEDIFDDSQSTATFNQTIAYLSGEGSIIRFPHDTWADVIEGHGTNMNPFKAVIQDIRRKISDSKYEEYKRLAVTETWEQIVRRYRRNSVREKDSFLSLSDILTNNFTLSELEKDVDVEMIREVCSSNSELPIAARVLSRIQAAKPTQINKIININDSVINRSNLNFEGDENVNDSVINKE